MPAVDGFLREYLRTWDGKTHREPILGLMCFLPLQEFGGMYKPLLDCFSRWTDSSIELHETFLNPVDRVLKDNDVSTVSLINFYTELLNQWRVTYQHRYPHEQEYEEGLTLRKCMTHAGKICLAGQVVGNDILDNNIYY